MTGGTTREEVLDVDAVLERATEAAWATISSGGGAAEALGWSEERLEAVYARGHVLYGQGDYEGAERLFGWLAQRTQPRSRTFLGLGAARQMMGSYEEALEAYSLAAVLDVEDPAPSVHAAECLLRLGRRGGARRAVEAARAQGAHSPGRMEGLEERLREVEATLSGRGVKG